MILNLEKKELASIAGGKKIACHVIEIFKKGAEAGGLAFCLSGEAVGVLPVVARNVRREGLREPTSKAVCSLMVTSVIETLAHTMEAVFRADCQ